MEKTNKKKCPKCGSENVFATLDRRGDPAEVDRTKDMLEANQPIYQCKEENCGERFIYLGD